MILVDSSIWISHLRFPSEELAAALNAGRVLVHPFVIGELACGNLAGRREMLRFLSEMPAAPMASHDEALAFLEEHALMGKGIGLVDLHLLTSTSLADPALLWTRDRRLAAVAGALDIGYEASK